MTLTYLGGKSIGSLMPLAVSAQAQLTTSLALPMLDLQARLAGAIEVSARVALTPPTFAASLQTALQLIANLQAQIALGLPDVAIDVSGTLLVIAELQAQVTALQVALDFAASLSASFGTGGIHAYLLDGTAGELVPGGVPGGTGGSERAYGLALVTTNSTTWSAMRTAFAI